MSRLWQLIRRGVLGQGSTIGNSIILFGDSISLANEVHPTDNGFFNWANVLFRHKFKVIRNTGVGGNTTTQMLARLNTDVIAYRPRWVCVLGGANDIVGDVGADTIYNNLVSICSILRGCGINVILCTITPTSSMNSEARTTVYDTVNTNLRAYAAANPKIVFADIGEEYRNTGSAYAIPLDTYTHDGTHPSALGAGVLGLKMYADIKDHSLVEKAPTFAVLPTTNDTGNQIYFNVYCNPLMTGTTGWKTAPAAGTVATGWVVSGGGTWSKVARTDGLPGEWQQVVIGDEGLATLAQYDVTDKFSVGDTIYSQIEIESDDNWTDPSAFTLYLAALNASNSVLVSAQGLGHSAGGGSGSVIINPRFGVVRTAPIVIPATTTKLRIYCALYATAGTVRFSRFETKKL